MDARTFRISWPPGTTLFELDQEELLEAEASILAAVAVRPACDRREVAADLKHHDWPELSCRTGYSQAAPLAWLAEGLF